MIRKIKRERKMIALKNTWRNFINLVLDPWVLLFSVALGVLFFVFSKQTDFIVISILTVILSIVSGILGSVLLNRWKSINDEKIIVARGNTAVRSLKLLLRGIDSLGHRVQEYLIKFCDEQKNKKINKEIIRTYFEEILNKSDALEEAALSSIENWTDIIPEADIKTQIGVISGLKNELYKQQFELNTLRKISKSKDKSIKKIKNLEKRIQEKEIELLSTQSELDKKSIDFMPTYSISSGSKTVSPYALSSNPADIPGLHNFKCKICKKSFSGFNPPFMGMLQGSAMQCPFCFSYEVKEVD